MDLDGLLIARLQFAFTIAFHIIFPTFTIGLAAFIAFLEGVWLKTKDERYLMLARFWTKVFALSFAMGVVSGIVMSYQFGTNWSGYSEKLGNVLGPLIGYEVLTAFFLEATFLGVMLFGWKRVPPWLHFLSSVIVAVGTTISAFWILSANSWMQHPVGHRMVDGVALPVDWFTIIFNPTFPLRFAHMVIAAYLTTAFVVMAVGARYLRRGLHGHGGRVMLRAGLGMALVLAPLQLFIGDAHGLKTAEVQPAKVAAMEAHWDSSDAAPLVLFAWPDEQAEANRAAIEIPYIASLIITHELDGKFPGLKDFPREDRPPVKPVFFSFRVMVGIGLLMILLALWGGWRWWRGRLFEDGWFLRAIAWSWPGGFVAVLAGWVVAETGRQPWVATGILRTVDAASPVAAGAVLSSLLLFIAVYAIVFAAGIYYINRLLEKGPPVLEDGADETPLGTTLSSASSAARAATEEA
ncbi:MAG: cytochrome ubiquinol oxidase subunit I [Rhodanobacteraceae bacterium]|nr:cytochrome ubiquinol oxidase subunit I [Xanthomonadales bacterium]MCP5479741.1 cytochrome ubiquinol oxidase subunit I [Rhodanobacteraceae bacterium]